MFLQINYETVTMPRYVHRMKLREYFITTVFCLFVWFDSLRPLNNLSVMRDGLPGLNQY